MITGFLLAALGLGDLARGVRSVAFGWVLAGAAWLALGVAAVAAARLPIGVAVAVVAVALSWSLAADGVRRRAPSPRWSPPLWAVLPLVAAVAAAVLLDRTEPGRIAAGSPLATLVAEVAPGVPSGVAVAGVGAALVLVRTANLVVRAALGRARLPAAPAPGAPGDPTPVAPVGEVARGWELRILGRRFGTVERRPEPPRATAPLLRGGRLIGPLERLLVVVLALSGGFAAMAALVAAKGIVRFPEISNDRGSGAKAEEFLIGSLTSWASAGAVAIVLVVLGAG